MSSLSNSRASLLIGFLAGGWIATLVFVFAMGGGPATDGILPSAAADDPPNAQPQPGGIPLPPIPNPFDTGPSGAGPITPGGDRLRGRGIPNPGGGTSDSNNRAIALSASNGGGESLVYYFDTVNQRVLVYQYKGLVSGNRPLRPGDKGGLRLLAARHIDFDLKLEGYRDLSERTREDLRAMWESNYGSSKAKKKGLPVKKVNVGGG